MDSRVILKKGEGRLLKKGGLWIYDNEIDREELNGENGSIVDVLDFDGYFLGNGFINVNSKIRIRMLTRRSRIGEDISLDELIEKRVKDAWEYRKTVCDTSSCRIIFGEADFLPGIVIDKFADILVVESLALGIDRLKEKILNEVKKILKNDDIYIRGIYERSDSKVRLEEGLQRYKGFIGDEFDTKVLISENDVKYYVDVCDGQKTGFFLDQKYNRKAVAGICKDKEVLDCFTHTGSFALNAAKGGAAHVTAVDISQTGIDQARENAELNGLGNKIDFVVSDVFDYLPKVLNEGKKYDVIILDPPAFTKSRDSVKNASKGYKEINLRAMKILKDGGYLATCSCSHFMTQELFLQAVASAAKDAHKRIRQVEYRTQGPDHPVLWNSDTSFYLKFLILQVCDER
ncbi:MAG: class I SAM-dependent rRNA methyltransferase [Lachnospiraceae bacterium]|nr:class I SAM-dependent rRNA methyltransferase [Lachnospiraceae bacterium]MBR3581112.1 class I SAM-dependent rRNA methyltransferase [Lachnospiraceae bacterium]